VPVATAMRWRVHVRSVVHTVHTWSGSVSRGSVSIIHYRIATSAAGHWRFVAGRRTVLRHSQRNSTREERGSNRETFQHGHHVLQMLTPLTRMSRLNPSRGLLF
jgi:hypothetical protein